MAMRLFSHAEQLAGHLRSELLRGTWQGIMPGVLTLETQLGVNRNTVQAALRLLEGEGLLVPEGMGRARRIRVPDNFAPRSLRLQILPYERSDRTWHVMLDLQHRLLDAGHNVGVASRTMLELGMDVGRVAHFVEKCEADAWVIISGSREILEWFAVQPLPAFALFGRRRNVPIAGIGPDKTPALAEVVQRLAGLGHKRIVMLMRQEQIMPVPGALGRAFLGELAAQGLPVGDYNLPCWPNSPEGLLACLDSLFAVSPPTALIVDEAFLAKAAQHHLARRGIRVPEHVSLVCLDPDPSFDWYRPRMAHIRWDPRLAVKRIVAWSANVARGKDDRRNDSFKAVFVESGTMGPPRKH